MKITYTAPNRAHHYPYAEAFHRAGCLHAFISGFSRFSPRSPLPSIGHKLKRHDFFQNLYLASLRFGLPQDVTSFFNQLTNDWHDKTSYKWAKDSDIFIYYRTQGFKTSQRIHMEDRPCLCIMEEVNSHIEIMESILSAENKKLGLGKFNSKSCDYRLRLKAYDEADYILCPSEFVRRSFISKGFSNERLIKLNFGIPSVEVSQINRKKNNNRFRLLYVGQLHYRKGLRYAIDAFSKLKHPQKEFIIVGPKTSVTGLEKTRIPEGVVFTGPLKGEALKEQYRNASVFVLPSLEEGLALVQGEALSFGLPLLITTNTGGDDLIKDGIEGFIVQPGEVFPLADRLQQMSDDKDLLNCMSEAALKTATTLGSWDIAIGKLLIEFTKILKGRNRKTQFLNRYVTS